MWYSQVSLPGGSRIDTYRLKASSKVLVPSIVQYCQHCLTSSILLVYD